MDYKAEFLHQSTSAAIEKIRTVWPGKRNHSIKKAIPVWNVLLPPHSKTSISDGGFPVSANGEGEAHEQCTTVPSGYDGRVDPIIAAFGLGPVVGTTGGGRSSSFGARAACR
jgi:hypothetical protein